MAKNFPQKRDVPRQMSGVTWVYDHPVVHIIWNIFKKSVVRKWQKSVFQSSKRNIQCLEKKRRKHCKSYHQGLHQNHHQHQFSNYIDKFWFVFLNSQCHINHIYKTGVSDRVKKGSLHKIQLLKSQIVSKFLFAEFSEKDDFGSDMLAMGMCYIWMIKGNNNHIHFLISDGW